MSATIRSLNQPLLLSVYKFLGVSEINKVTLTSKHLKNSTNTDVLWRYLVKRDLTERDLKLEPGNSYKKIYLEGKSEVLDHFYKHISDLKKMSRLEKKEYSELLENEKQILSKLRFLSKRNDYLLQRSAILGYEKCFELILKNLNVGIDDCSDGSGTTALCFASHSNHVHCIEKLLLLGANINIRDKMGRGKIGLTPLGYAVSYGHVDAVRFLLTKGADPKSIGENELTRLDDDINRCDIKIKQEIKALIMEYKDKSQLKAPGKGQKAEVNIMPKTISNIPQPVLLSIYKFLDVSDVNNILLTSTHMSNSTNNPSFWVYLIRRDLTDRPLGVNENPKEFYIKGKNLLMEISRMFENYKALKKHEKRDSRNMSDEERKEYYELSGEKEGYYQLLRDAAGLGYEKCIDLIIATLGVTVDECHPEVGDTALSQAAQNNQVHCLEKLLSLGADLENVDAFGATPLVCAVVSGALNAVEFLIKKGANINKVSESDIKMLNESEDCDDNTKEEIKNLLLKYRNDKTPNL